MKYMFIALSLILVLFIAGCGGGQEAAIEQTASDTSTETSDTTGLSCSDTEDGNNKFVKGTVTGTDEAGNEFSKTDTCVTNEELEFAFLTEYYCDGNKLASENHVCDKGCEDGACEE